MIPTELLKKIRRIEIRTSRTVNDVLAGQYHSAFKGRGMEFEEVRQYQIGDDVRTIDWNVSARAGEPFVKVFREERELTVMLLVDLSASQSFGTNLQQKRELIAEIGATLALSAIRNNDKVGLICFTDRVELFVPPRKGPRHVLRVIRELIALEPVGRGTDLAVALEYLNRIQKRKCTTFMISDFIDSGFETAMQIARRKHDLIAVDVRDRFEEELPRIGLVELQDNETGETVLLDTNSNASREAYRSMAASRQSELDTWMNRCRIDRLALRTGESFVESLSRFFKRREARKGR
ncbi:MAG: DUF58 domain-containing protein [Phycisphaerae bacterium]|jgi:uncharacterized protein (DUF58 family)|nr:DUF58 domain-containing protein [Phycisphaerae bacterium]|tara:strand:+ start:5266 stop:6147 length:882 start_codon:yes stop_codon:yes gene_type:complete